MNIGWIGTGLMGLHMCKHVMQGHNCFVFNRTKEKAQELLDAGATWCNSPKEVAQNSDIVFTIVGYPKDVKQVIIGENSVLHGLKEGGIVVDMTTSNPSLAKKIYQACKEKNISAIDAPVSGGNAGAINGSLSIMVGGDEDVYKEILPLLQKMGKAINYMGPAGSGQHTKACNQIAVAGNMLGVAEALTYAKHAGLDMHKVVDLLANGAAGSWVMKNLGHHIVDGDFAPGFYIKHLIKDLGICGSEAKDMQLDLPTLQIAQNLYNKAKESGYEDLNFIALYKVIEDMNS